ncbi:MAG: PmoA family protein [Armatimonadota bacterium]
MSDHVFVDVEAGNHDRENTVVYAPMVLAEEHASHVVHEVNEDGSFGDAVPAQCIEACECGAEDLEDCECGCQVAFIVPSMAAGESKRFAICTDECDDPGFDEVIVELDEDAKTAAFMIGDEMVTRYNFDFDEFVRPNCYPVYGPGGLEVTEYAQTDHPHHKSMYVALGEVNGTNNWDEQEGHGYSKCQSVTVLAEGPVFAQLLAVNDWLDNKENKLMEEWTVITVYNMPETGRIIDWDITFVASEKGIHIGDTKESGTLSVRMLTELHEKGHTGTIVNAYGGIGEGENWGKPSPWVDYHGELEGQKVGLAIFDSPYNLRFPTTWHVRSYGLFTANCWGYSYFTGDQSKRGDYTMPVGDTLNFVYRVYVHAGDTEEAKVGERWFDFAYPPKVSAVEEE